MVQTMGGTTRYTSAFDDQFDEFRAGVEPVDLLSIKKGSKPKRRWRESPGRLGFVPFLRLLRDRRRHGGDGSHLENARLASAGTQAAEATDTGHFGVQALVIGVAVLLVLGGSVAQSRAQSDPAEAVIGRTDRPPGGGSSDGPRGPGGGEQREVQNDGSSVLEGPTRAGSQISSSAGTGGTRARGGNGSSSRSGATGVGTSSTTPPESREPRPPRDEPPSSPDQPLVQISAAALAGADVGLAVGLGDGACVGLRIQTLVLGCTPDSRSTLGVTADTGGTLLPPLHLSIP